MTAGSTDSVKLTRLVENTLNGVPGTRHWAGCGGVARLIVSDLLAAGAVISFPEGAPDIKPHSQSDAAFARLVARDQADR